MLHYGRTVRLVPGIEQNFKITTPLDLAIAEMILLNRETGMDCGAAEGQQWREALLRPE